MSTAPFTDITIIDNKTGKVEVVLRNASPANPETLLVLFAARLAGEIGKPTEVRFSDPEVHQVFAGHADPDRWPNVTFTLGAAPAEDEPEDDEEAFIQYGANVSHVVEEGASANG